MKISTVTRKSPSTGEVFTFASFTALHTALQQMAGHADPKLVAPATFLAFGVAARANRRLRRIAERNAELYRRLGIQARERLRVDPERWAPTCSRVSADLRGDVAPEADDYQAAAE